eukprot:8582200-Heterocapsa_arctica.AAC.1
MSLCLVKTAEGVTMTISPWAIHLNSAACLWCFVRDDNNNYGAEVICRTGGQLGLYLAQARLMVYDLEKDAYLC